MHNLHMSCVNQPTFLVSGPKQARSISTWTTTHAQKLLQFHRTVNKPCSLSPVQLSSVRKWNDYNVRLTGSGLRGLWVLRCVVRSAWPVECCKLQLVVPGVPGVASTPLLWKWIWRVGRPLITLQMFIRPRQWVGSHWKWNGLVLEDFRESD